MLEGSSLIALRKANLRLGTSYIYVRQHLEIVVFHSEFHDTLPHSTSLSISVLDVMSSRPFPKGWAFHGQWHDWDGRSEEHTSELQSQTSNIVCRLLLEKKKKQQYKTCNTRDD